MRVRYSRDRKQDLKEFVFMYRQEIAAIDSTRGDDYCVAAKKFVEAVARPLLEYSKVTYYLDIMRTLRNMHNKIKTPA